MTTERYGRYRKHHDHSSTFHLDRDTKIGLGIMFSILLAVFFLTSRSIGGIIQDPKELTTAERKKLEEARRENERKYFESTGGLNEGVERRDVPENRGTPINLGNQIPDGQRTQPQPSLPAFTWHTIAGGDTLSGISRKYYGTSAKWPIIKKYNSFTDKQARTLRIGTKIKIPRLSQSPGAHSVGRTSVPAYSPLAIPAGSEAEVSVSADRYYTTQAGDNHYALARKLLGNPRKMDELQRKNPGVNLKDLQIGVKIRY